MEIFTSTETVVEMPSHLELEGTLIG